MTTDLEFLKRFMLMLNQEQVKKLVSTRIIVFGTGGVGSAVCNFLVRSGISNLTIVDFDKIDITNINRQLVANISNVGNLKVEEMKKQLLNINPNANITALAEKYDENSKIDLGAFDIIIDCIDDIKAKKHLISQAKKNGTYMICSMGAGNRYNEIPQFEIADISKTSYDPIAKILRKYCAENRIKKLDVCYTKQKATKFDCKTVASVVYYPVMMAGTIVAKVITKIVN